MSYETQSQWNLDELKKLNKAALWGMHKAYVALVIGIEVMMVAGIILSVIISSPKLITEFVVLLVGFPVALYLITNYRLKQTYKTNKIIQTAVTTLKFTEDRLEAVSERGNAFVKYDEIYRILETDTNFYLFLAKNQAINVIKANCSEELISFLHEKMVSNSKNK